MFIIHSVVTRFVYDYTTTPLIIPLGVYIGLCIPVGVYTGLYIPPRVYIGLILTSYLHSCTGNIHRLYTRVVYTAKHSNAAECP